MWIIKNYLRQSGVLLVLATFVNNIMTYRAFLQDALRQAKLDYEKKVRQYKLDYEKTVRQITQESKLNYSIYKLQEETKKKNDPARIRHKFKTRSEANRRYREKKHP